MILILGTGYVAQAFARELSSRSLDYDMMNRRVLDYPSFSTLAARLNFKSPDLLINAAGFCGTPNVDEVESRQAEAILSNVVLPTTISHAAALMHIPWIHISSGCIFDGASPDGAWTECDTPNFGFDNERHSFYSATKELAERAISGISNCYVCRLRMPFDNVDHPKNLLTKLASYAQVYDSPANSLSHLGESVRACVDLWANRMPAGIYNIVNPGTATNREIVGMIQEILKPNRDFCWWTSDAAFYRIGAKAPRSNCVLSPSKLLAAGIQMRDVREALADSLKNWKAQ